MENGTIEHGDYSFLNQESVEKHFADININLLSGRHIDNSNYALFTVLEEYEIYWKEFYKRLYKLNFITDVFDGRVYYYLDFFESGKGKLSENTRHRGLTEMQTITGLLLLDMYYQRYFDDPKIISWSDIKREIDDGDNKENYQKILFDDVRASYSVDEWQRVENKFKSAINTFDKIGWIDKRSGQNEELLFEIRPAIHRMAKLYETELQDFDQFTKNLRDNGQL